MEAKSLISPVQGLEILRITVRTVEYKELYTGTPNSDIRILCTAHCKQCNVNKTSALTEVEGKRTGKL